MARYRRRGVVEATLWNKPGDHPDVYRDERGRYIIPTKSADVVMEPDTWIVEDDDGLEAYDDETFHREFEPAAASGEGE